MRRPTRRELLQGSGAFSVSAFAGCISIAEPSGTESPRSTDETTNDASSLTDWERSTGCDGMHDSVIEVIQVTTVLGDGYAPIHFSNLPAEEKAILRTVTEEGGYDTCDPSAAFDRFVERVIDHRKRQPEDGHVYVEREGTYYALYVEVLDQVFAL